jgi:hypothetical protein
MLNHKILIYRSAHHADDFIASDHSQKVSAGRCATQTATEALPFPLSLIRYSPLYQLTAATTAFTDSD